MADGPDPTATGTRTLAGARDHARSLAGAEAGSGPTVPASAAADGLPSASRSATVVWAETIGSGGYASRRLPRGSVLRVSDTEGDGCVHLLVHNAAQPAERLNVADTVKVQWQAYLGEGALLLSDMGRVMMTIVSDTSQRHDCLCGATVRRTNELRYGDAFAGGRHPSARDLLALGVAKHGMSRRDLAPSVNLFKSVRVDDTGALHLDGAPRPGTHIDLRAEMDVVVTMANTPHPLAEHTEYRATEVSCLAWLPIDEGQGGDDRFRLATPERTRAFQNTDEYLLGAGR